MNLYPQISSILSRALDDAKVETIGDGWEVFKLEYKKLKKSKPKTITDFGLQSEFFVDETRAQKIFYFAFHYRVHCKIDCEEYDFYELVYCEYDLSHLEFDPSLKKGLIEEWESLLSFTNVLDKVENWDTFHSLKSVTAKYEVTGTEV